MSVRLQPRLPSLSRRLRARLSVELLESRTVPSAYNPAQIRHAYGIDQVAFNGGAIKGDGAGQTIAIVDAYYDSTIQSDLAAFSQRFGLAQLDGKAGNGLFTQLDLSNHTPSPPNDNWAYETALDVEWAHAVAPRANIILVEAASDLVDPTGKPTDLLNAVQVAASRSGVSTVSMSWGVNETAAETSWDSVFSQPGVTYVAASGDSGAGTIWPAVSPNVLSVGGTTLRLTSSGTISSETGWGYGGYSWLFGGSGGGFSQYEPLPAYQTNAGISTTLTQFGVRLNPDVAYDADPNTGFLMVSGGSWFSVGGTSAGAPQWAALVAIANQGRQLANEAPLSSAQTLAAVYANPSAFHDITKGSTGAYAVVDGNGNVVGRINVAAGPGYDMVTGQGSPMATKVVSALVGTATGSAALSVTAPTKPTSPASNSSASGGGSAGAKALARIDAGVLMPSAAPVVQIAPATFIAVSTGVAAIPAPAPSVSPYVSAIGGGYTGATSSDDDDADEIAALESAAAVAAPGPVQRISGTVEGGAAQRATTSNQQTASDFASIDYALTETPPLLESRETSILSVPVSVDVPPQSSALLLGVVFALAWRERTPAEREPDGRRGRWPALPSLH